MTVLSQALRSIRTRRGETTSRFGEMLGCHQATISKYERGNIVPSRSMLLLVYRLAETPAEKAAIAEALGGPPESLARQESDADAPLRAAVQQLRLKEHDDLSSRRMWDRLANLVADLSNRPDVPLWLVEELHLWILYRDHPMARREFEAHYSDLVNRLELIQTRAQRASELGRDAAVPEVEEILHGQQLQSVLGDYRATHKEKRRSPQKLDELPLRIMAECPQTKLVYWTGYETNRKNFDADSIQGMRVKCGHCGSTHTLSSKELFLSVQEPGGGSLPRR